VSTSSSLSTFADLTYWYYKPHISREHHLFPSTLQKARRRGAKYVRISLCGSWQATYIESGLDDLPKSARACEECSKVLDEREAKLARRRKWLAAHPGANLKTLPPRQRRELAEVVGGKKVCTGCKKLKNAQEFYNLGGTRDGKDSKCKVCVKLQRNGVNVATE
jgi:hypothetical protein